MFEIKDSASIHEVCLVAHNPKIDNCDYLGATWTNPGEPTQFAYRFRYHREHLGLPDEWSWYGPSEVTEALNAHLDRLEQAVELLSRTWGGAQVYRLRDATKGDLLAWLANLERQGHINLNLRPS